jgi:hypothetical protein
VLRPDPLPVWKLARKRRINSCAPGHANHSASVGAPVIADVDKDGASEILVSLGDGRLCLLRTDK